MKSEKEILEALKKSVVDADEKLLMPTTDVAVHAEAPVTESWAEEIGADAWQDTLDAVKKENAR